ncbi:dihydropteroate synthase [Rhodobacteraceae bacterium D3-12]|nr:dihydropteroate synthase [Rhodobacteraceae bacterium D3-12]
METYYRPLVQTGPRRPDDALPLVGGASCWFNTVEAIRREGPSEFLSAADIPDETRRRLSAPRTPIAGLSMDQARIMGILNVTPDSFSDGGKHSGPAAALAHAKRMVSEGADIIDVGGESTRPGAQTVPEEAEIARTAPVIAAIRSGLEVPMSIDTRKAEVARAAHEAGAMLVNDVSGFTYDKALSQYCVANDLPVCVMHAQGDPETMHLDPRYDDVLLDVYDFLAAQVIFLRDLGIPRERIVVDPGIGFGKTLKHNLRILSGISLFHGLGCPVLLGASRKGFIGTLSAASNPAERMPGSVAVALGAVAQGVQIVRVHDVRETRQALALWTAVARAGAA